MERHRIREPYATLPHRGHIFVCRNGRRFAADFFRRAVHQIRPPSRVIVMSRVWPIAVVRVSNTTSHWLIWRRRTFRSLEATLEWLVDFLRAEGNIGCSDRSPRKLAAAMALCRVPLVLTRSAVLCPTYNAAPPAI
jgi:hypothetical protein